MKSTASILFERYKNNTDCLVMADAWAVGRDQFWKHETTVFEFADGSKLRISPFSVEVI